MIDKDFQDFTFFADDVFFDNIYFRDKANVRSIFDFESSEFFNEGSDICLFSGEDVKIRLKSVIIDAYLFPVNSASKNADESASSKGGDIIHINGEKLKSGHRRLIGGVYLNIWHRSDQKLYK